MTPPLLVMDRVLFSAATDRWSTPKAVYAALEAEFHFTFDPCPLDGSTDGLAPLFTEWHGKRVFCNPPYGPGIEKWLLRGLEAEVSVFLIPARTDTRWFHEIVLPRAKEIRFLRGRLKFGDSTNSAPFPSMIVVFEHLPVGPPWGTALRDADNSAEEFLIEEEGPVYGVPSAGGSSPDKKATSVAIRLVERAAVGSHGEPIDT